MLGMASKLSEYKVLSLQTGLPIAEIDHPIIDPKKLRIVAFKVKGGIVSKNRILRTNEGFSKRKSRSNYRFSRRSYQHRRHTKDQRTTRNRSAINQP